MKLSNFFKGLGLAVIAFGLVTQPAWAAEFLAPGPDNNGNVTVPSTETHRNLYVAGGNVTISSNTDGDLYAAGGNVVVEGAVEQDLAVGGGNVTISSQVGGDVRLGAGTATITAPVAGDILAGAGTLTLSEKATVGGDVIVGGGDIVINAPVAGSLRIGGGNVTINSKVGGKVWIEAGEQLTFGPQADIAGEINYTGRKQAVIENGAKVSTVNFTEMPGQKHNYGRSLAGILTLKFLIKALAMIVAGLVIVKLFRNRSNLITSNIYKQPWKNLGLGILAAIIVPIVTILLFITFIGYYLALILLLWYVLILLCACLFGAIFLGAWLIKLLTKKPELVIDWQAVVIGCVIYSLLAFIPIVGWVLMMLLGLMAIGSFMQVAKHQINVEKSQVTVN
jgi:hypothetical protein